MPAEAAAGAVQRHRGTRAVQRMVEYAPATGSLALWARHEDRAAGEGPELADNDGHTIRYGPGFEGLSLPRQTGVVAHQVLHVALRHAPRYLELERQRGDVDLELWNVCADAIVLSALDHLGWLDPGDGARLEYLLAVTLDVHQAPEQSLLEWDLERLYRAVDDRGPPPARRRGGSGHGGRAGGATREGRGTGAGDAREAQRRAPRPDGPRAARVRALGRGEAPDLVPGAADTPPEAESEAAREWRERIRRGHAADGGASLLRALLADLPRIHTPWEQLLRTRLARGLSLRPALSWSRPARSYIANQGRAGPGRRMPWEPGRSSRSAVARLAVLVDVSGSIEEPLLQRFARELEAITRRLEAGMVVIVGDDRVRGVERFEPGRSNLRELRFRGGGGTDFAPLLREAEGWRPDLAVFLTDLQGPADYRPAYPVIWAVPRAHADNPHPFGERLVLD